MPANIKTTRLVIVSLLIALEVVLGTFLTINIAGIAKFGLAFLPIAMIAILYGPWWAGSAYALGDVISYFIKPEGAYFPGLTLTCFLIGVLFGLFLYNKEITFSRSGVTAVVVVFSMDFILNTFWLHILMNQGFFALLPSRIAKCLILVVMEAVLIPLVWNNVMLKVPVVRQELDAASRNA
jgi:ECF transporter S component (folate family)